MTSSQSGVLELDSPSWEKEGEEGPNRVGDCPFSQPGEGDWDAAALESPMSPVGGVSWGQSRSCPPLWHPRPDSGFSETCHIAEPFLEASWIPLAPSFLSAKAHCWILQFFMCTSFHFLDPLNYAMHTPVCSIQADSNFEVLTSCY